MDTDRLFTDTYNSVIWLLIIAAIFIPLEYFFPLLKAQKIIRKGWTADLLHKLIGFILVTEFSVIIYVAFVFLMQHLLIFLAEHNFNYLGIALYHLQSFIRNQPFAVQFIEMLLIGDLVFYTFHRLSHHVPILWRLHAIHHSADEMDWLVAYRFHPIDQGIFHGLSSVVLGLLGFTAGNIFLVMVIGTLIDPLVHANIRFRFGFLEKIIVTPFFHHWHHTNERVHFDKNFAGRFPIIDIIFGSYYLPERRSNGFGISTPVPVTYFGQLLAPFLTKSIKERIFKKEDLFIATIIEPSTQTEPVHEVLPETTSTV